MSLSCLGDGRASPHPLLTGDLAGTGRVILDGQRHRSDGLAGASGAGFLSSMPNEPRSLWPDS